MRARSRAVVRDSGLRRAGLRRGFERAFERDLDRVVLRAAMSGAAGSMDPARMTSTRTGAALPG